MRPPTLRPSTPAAPPPLQRKSESVANQPKTSREPFDPPLGSPRVSRLWQKQLRSLTPRACLSFQSRPSRKKQSWNYWIPLLDPPVYPAYEKTAEPRAHLSFKSRPSREIIGSTFWIPPCIPPMKKTAELRAHLSFQSRPSREIFGSPLWIPLVSRLWENQLRSLTPKSPPQLQVKNQSQSFQELINNQSWAF